MLVGTSLENPIHFKIENLKSSLPRPNKVPSHVFLLGFWHLQHMKVGFNIGVRADCTIEIYICIRTNIEIQAIGIHMSTNF